ncbi:FAD-dependent monooxygenase [Streptomyces xiaopingdaonensis]|uniref:FAD-dependent monooxygenase n=1 Tax=Streptomyces xiaopingdaonensis TaxID=1565415 RepID=UPI0002E1E9E5|nr:FAD-dependent monooxygenase [Streptomyces xiaopingdaonensis]
MNPVIVVGAGPTGLALALALARHSVPSLVLEAAVGPPEPRAARTCVLRPDTAARLPSLPALSWKGLQVRRRNQLIRRELLDADDEESEETSSASRAPAIEAPLHLPQHALQQTLREALRGEECVRFLPGARLESLEQNDYGVTAHVAGADVPPQQGSYLVGCDGARSTVRKLLGVRFPGRTSVERHAVATVRTRLPWEDEALLHRDPGGGTAEVLARPLPGELWRLDWLLPPRGELVTPEELLDRVQETLSRWHRSSGAPSRGRSRGKDGDAQPGPYELVDTGVHTTHQRLARRWRTGRVFLAGDAAHQLGALGVQQVDEGLRDVGNLAWKLALAWRRGDAAAEDEGCQRLLDSYESERRGAVGARLRAVDQALPLVRRDGGLRALLGTGARTHLELLADTQLGRGMLGAPASYASSPLMPVKGTVPPAACSTTPGALVEDVEVTALDGRRGRLHERLWGAGGDLLVVLVAPGTRVWDSRHWLSAGMMPQLASAVEGLPLRAQLVVTEGYPGAAAHTVLVVRADGHLVAALPGGRDAELRTCADAVRGITAAHRTLAGKKPTGRRG